MAALGVGCDTALLCGASVERHVSVLEAIIRAVEAKTLDVRTVEDAALAMNVMAGHDPKDVASAKVSVPDYTTALTGDVRGLRVGVPEEYFDAPLDPHVGQAVRDALDLLESMGAVVKPVSFSMFKDAFPISTAILMAEASAYHRDLLAKDAEQLYPPIRLRLEAGLFISSAERTN